MLWNSSAGTHSFNRKSFLQFVHSVLHRKVNIPSDIFPYRPGLFSKLSAEVWRFLREFPQALLRTFTNLYYDHSAKPPYPTSFYHAASSLISLMDISSADDFRTTNRSAETPISKGLAEKQTHLKEKLHELYKGRKTDNSVRQKKHKDLILKDLVLFKKDPVLFKKRTYVFQSIITLELLFLLLVG